jgi:hypothetical protein
LKKGEKQMLGRVGVFVLWGGWLSLSLSPFFFNTLSRSVRLKQPTKSKTRKKSMLANLEDEARNKK